LLSKLGDNVDRLRIPFVHRLRRDDGEGRVWGAIIDRVLRRPALSAALAAGVLVALAVPAIQLHTANPSIDTYPQNLLKTYKRMKAAFPGTQVAANVVVKAPNVDAPAMKEAIGQLEWRALSHGLMYEPIDVDVNEAKTVANISIPVRGSGTDSKSNEALAALRDEIVPVTVGSVSGAVAGVTGETAQSKDFNDQMKTVAPLVFGFVLLFAFVLMLVSFRSLVIAAKTIVLNLLSVGAAYGILVLVFQHGWGKQLLGFEFTGGIDPFLPILLFVILFGLSMDYHVFVLSRVREGYESGMTTDEAVAHGIKSTAGVVTSAAIVMVGVFAIFATLQMMIFKQFGVGLASAILIDATLIRAILLPASMKRLGDWNWYLPRWLEWLPRLEHEKTPEAPPAQVAGS
jgi:RND superfamily putative drug exporter